MTLEPKRGDIWTVAGGGGNLTSKPRPVLIVTSDVFADLDFVTILLTRIPIPASRATGLAEPSMIQVDKIVTVHRRNLRQRCGYVPPTVLARVREVASAYLGFVG